MVITSSMGMPSMQPETGRSDVDGALRVVERIGLIGAARSQLPRELHGIFAVGKLTRKPKPNRSRSCSAFAGWLARDRVVKSRLR